MRTNEYETLDAKMSSFVLACEHNGMRFYLADLGLATDTLSRAEIFKSIGRAEETAKAESGWEGFRWTPVLYVEARNRA